MIRIRWQHSTCHHVERSIEEMDRMILDGNRYLNSDTRPDITLDNSEFQDIKSIPILFSTALTQETGFPRA